MPTLSDEDYLVRHVMLHRVWGKDTRPFTHLTYQQQSDIHDYYQPAKILTNEELLAHRKKITKTDPSLPHRASRAFLVMLRPETQPEPASAGIDAKGRKITVRPLVKPEIDTEKLASALLDMVKKMTPEERAELQARYLADQEEAA